MLVPAAFTLPYDSLQNTKTIHENILANSNYHSTALKIKHHE